MTPHLLYKVKEYPLGKRKCNVTPLLYLKQTKKLAPKGNSAILIISLCIGN